MVRSQEQHGMWNTPTYWSWVAMKQRCTNKNQPSYQKYGAKGITYCPEWELFSRFFQDMGSAPKDHTLDRIDSLGNYCKENCRWATGSVQSYNRKGKKQAGINKHSKVDKWDTRITVNYKVIYLGLYKSYEEALSVRKAAELAYYGFNVNE